MIANNELTAETRAYIAISGLAENAPKAKAFADYVRFRVEVERMSLINAPQHFNTYLKQFVDKALRVRHDYLEHDTLIVERFSEEGGGWLHVMVWPGAKDGQAASAKEVADMLLEGDMQRFGSTMEYVQWKRNKSAKVREANEKRVDDKILGAVDSLSAKRIRNFLEVERALHTGETICFKGDDAKKFDRMRQASLKAEAEGVSIPGNESCINPGGNPLTHQHIRR